MGVCFLYGNGGNGEKDRLNFRVFGGLTALESPKENDIWVKISSTSFEWAILASGASAQNRSGRVLIKTGTGNTNEFQALIDVIPANQLWISPVGCVVGDGITWKNLDAYLYKDGAWVQFSSAQYAIFNAGGATDYSGGWNAYAYKSQSSGSTPKAPTFTLGATIDISLYGQYAYNMGTVFSEAAIDLTKYSTLVIEIASTQTGVTSSGEYGGFNCGLCASKQNNWTPAATATNVSAGTHTIDISALSGSYYLSLSLGGVGQGLTGKASIARIYLK